MLLYCLAGKDRKANLEVKEEQSPFPGLVYDVTKTVDELGLHNDDIIFYVMKKADDEWEEIEVEGLYPPPEEEKENEGLKPNTEKKNLPTMQ